MRQTAQAAFLDPCNTFQQIINQFLDLDRGHIRLVVKLESLVDRQEKGQFLRKSLKWNKSSSSYPTVYCFHFSAETEINFRDTLVTVFYNGTILWVPHQRIKSSCSINVTNFPFDTQQCHMWFGSWTYTTNEINLTMAFDEGIDLQTFHADFKDTSQWAISK